MKRNFVPPQVYDDVAWAFHPVWLVTFLSFYVVYLVLWLRPFWQMYRECPGGRTFQFHIPDYWAALMGLVPSFMLAADALNDPRTQTLVVASVMAASQISGVFIGRVHNVLPPSGELKGQWEEAGWIFLGAMFGLLLIAIGIVLFTLGLLALQFSVLWAPPLVLCLIVYKAIKRI